MIWQLREQRMPKSDRSRIEFLLRHARWVWPPDLDTKRLQWIATQFDGLAPPAMQAGQVPLVSYNDGNATVWMLGGHDLPAQLPAGFGSHGYEWGVEALRAWDDALLATSRSLPILFRPLTQARSEPLRVVPLGSLNVDGTPSVPGSVMTGRSFGLAFLLSCVSRIFGMPVAEDIAASAEVDSEGRVGGVGGLPQKLGAIVEIAPRVRRLLVHVDQVNEVQALPLGQIEIIGVESARHAIDLVFGNRLAEPIVAAASDSRLRAELIQTLFRLALGKRGHLVSWRAVREAATLAESSWSKRLSADSLYDLRFARAIAGRHDDNEGALELPTESWLARWPLPTRIAVVAHVVQQCADTGTPAAEEVERLAARYVVDPLNAHPAQLRLAGALARLAAVRGRPEEALGTQRLLARAFFANLEFDEISFQLSEWYRLAGVLGDSVAFNEAEALRRDVLAVGGFGLDGNVYVELARCRAMILLPEHGKPAAMLSELSAAPVDHVRWSAIRWMARLTGRYDDDGVQSLRATATAPASSPSDERRRREASTFVALVEIDRAIACGGSTEAERRVDELANFEPGLIGHLLEAAPARQRAEYVARFYPY
jgi:hypothetical protein